VIDYKITGDRGHRSSECAVVVPRGCRAGMLDEDEAPHGQYPHTAGVPAGEATYKWLWV
jgi:hypothetical protein